MSKKLNLSGSAANGASKQRNSILNYFTKSPAVEKKSAPGAPISAASTPVANKRKLKESSKSPKVDKADDDVIKQKPKRARLFDDDDDEEPLSEEDSLPDFSDEDEEEYKPDSSAAAVDDESEGSAVDEDASCDEAASDASEDEATPEKPRKGKKRAKQDSVTPPAKKPSTSSAPLAGNFMEKLAQLQAQEQSSVSTKDSSKYEQLVTASSTLDEPVVWPHQKLEFLLPSKIKDKNGCRPDHPDYDPSTLHVPKEFLNNLSPGVRQWWLLKSESFDCVLFFKVGKFYELYHMDADVGVNELGFAYMRGEFAHSGFPEISFDKMATILVDRGYKVARVEQTETPDMMAARCKQIKPTKFDKVVKREICQVTDRGTQVFGTHCAVRAMHEPNYMMSVVEQASATSSTSRYGVCFIDTSIGDFYIGEFADDKNCSRLLTLLSHNMPVLLLHERGSYSERTQQILRTVLGGILKESLPNNGAQVCSAERTLKYLAEQHYAKAAGSDNWPLVLRMMQDESDHLGLTPDACYKLALKALGQCIYYLEKCRLSVKVLPMARYQLYTPPDIGASELKSKLEQQQQPRRAHMVLDATTLANLRIIDEQYSLLATLDQCCTKFGKRQLHHWLCAPSCELTVIVSRQQAISALLAHTSSLQELRALFATMPDLERHLAQIHLFGNKRVMSEHPDGRAILFEEKLYNKKKLQNFIAILKGFEALTGLPKLCADCATSSSLIKQLSQLSENGGQFPDLRKQLEFFEHAFDHNEAAKSGVVAPQSGVDADYDEIEARIAEINRELQAYRVEQEAIFGCRIAYFGNDKKRYQLELPESHARKADGSYTLEGQRKGANPCRRYSTERTRALLKQMLLAEDKRNAVLKDLARRIFEKFSQHYTQWQQCIDCVAQLDVLAALAEYARTLNVVCVPELSAMAEQPHIELVEGYHPCANADTYIPNGVTLGTAGIAPLSILTGPNMGGKSTLMRQLGLLTIMAQIGAHLPAERCRLTLVDRIFTRLGAQDDILAGQSTFLVELNETSLILKHATKHSLVLLDELGRGTATYDGTAIAVSVVNYLAELQCRTLFSTHYHNLVDFFNKDKRVTLGHMACMVENEDAGDPTQETVTFLYKYTAGACPKSYGFNAAKLAGMPHAVIKRAYELSKRVESIALQRKLSAKLLASACRAGSADADVCAAIKRLVLQLKSCQV